MLRWLDQFSIFCFLDSCECPADNSEFEWLIAAEAKAVISQDLTRFADLNAPGKWWFGHLSYALGKAFLKVRLEKPPLVDLPDYTFFQPEFVLRLRGPELELLESPIPEAELIAQIDAMADFTIRQYEKPCIVAEDFSAYERNFNTILNHIRLGNCYEINYCRYFQATGVRLPAMQLFYELTASNPSPFAALYKTGEKYCICASPERFLKKQGRKLISQPIKGTVKRDLTDPANDEKLKAGLSTSLKDRTENVMITDLVRNDLSRVCKAGTVSVKEFCAVRTFPSVHHLVTTVEGELETTDFKTILQATFPMGSMTGAPKKRVMEITEQAETHGRGIFSGSIGYISPDGDFDFNVVIRSLILDEARHKGYFAAGGGITISSNCRQEFEETEAKALKIIGLLAETAF